MRVSSMGVNVLDKSSNTSKTPSTPVNTANHSSSEMPTGLHLLNQHDHETSHIEDQKSPAEHQIDFKMPFRPDTSVDKTSSRTKTTEPSTSETKSTSKKSKLGMLKSFLQSCKKLLAFLRLPSLKSSPKTLGKTVDQNVQVSKQERQQTLINAIANARDFAETETSPKSLRDSFEKGYNRGDVQAQIQTLSNNIDEKFNIAQNDVNSPLHGLSKAEFTTLALTNLVQGFSAMQFSSLDSNKLNEMAQNLGGQAGQLLSELGGLVDKGKTPLGSIELFGGLAKDAMKTGQEKTFLRSTTNPDSASVRKIMLANGGKDLELQFLQSFPKIQKNKISYVDESGKTQNFTIAQFSKDLNEIQKKSTTSANGVKNLKDGGITQDIALKIAAVAKEMIKMLDNISPPEDMCTILKEFKSNITQNPGFNQEGVKMQHNLFADQTILKIMSPMPLIKFPGNLAMKHAQDFIGSVANGNDDQSKYPEIPRDVFSNNSATFQQGIDNFLSRFGL